MPSQLTPTTRQALLRTGTFMLRTMPSAEWLAIRAQQHQPLPAHESVLRPLVNAASAAWVYALREDSEVFAVARPLLHREKGKHRIHLGGECIRGHELLWNASGGRRGSIALVLPLARFPGAQVFAHCHSAFVVGNSTVPHTPAAIRLARAAAADEGAPQVCCLLSRTNGFEWISVYAGAAHLEGLMEQALALVAQGQGPARGGA